MGTGGDTKALKPVGEWNRLSVTLKGKSAKIAVNGTGLWTVDLPTQGTLALRADGAMDYANLFVRELGMMAP